jgi:predicted 3-demethylubiquinone-9 3-methyltransferase (glyoxalase superfamily)
MPKISPFLWFDSEAEAAAALYTSVFPNSKITDVQRYGTAGPRPEGTVMTVQFELDGFEVMALNGGAEGFSFNEAFSFMVVCRDQAEVDDYWEKLTTSGGEPGPCGWLKDKFGLSWQVVPENIGRYFGGGDANRSKRVMAALLKMRKLSIAGLEKAYDGA